ncbi:hypothetical protein HOK021_30600 [Streptomyces hygroscopicus]|nr:hypothetical protein HOK021_30600 [Streptomyces hygroscopicus]
MAVGGGAAGRISGSVAHLRLEYASKMLEAGESVVVVARWLGHSSPAVTLGYDAHIAPEAGSRKPEAGSRKPEAGSKGRTVIEACAGPDLIVNCKDARSYSLGKC